jgi:hypothetical protein
MQRPDAPTWCPFVRSPEPSHSQLNTPRTDRTRHQRGVRSLLESTPRGFFEIGRIRSMMTGRAPASAPFPLASLRYVNIRHCQPDGPPLHLIALASRVQSKTEAEPFLAPLTGHAWGESGLPEARVWSLKASPPRLQLLYPCSNMLTTKCITLCTCVSNFSQTFSNGVNTH